MAFPGVFYWDKVQRMQLITSAFKCPKVFGWKLLETLKKCLIITAPCPQHRLFGFTKVQTPFKKFRPKCKQARAMQQFQWQPGQRFVEPFSGSWLLGKMHAEWCCFYKPQQAQRYCVQFPIVDIKIYTFFFNSLTSTQFQLEVHITTIPEKIQHWVFQLTVNTSCSSSFAIRVPKNKLDTKGTCFFQQKWDSWMRIKKNTSFVATMKAATSAKRKHKYFPALYFPVFPLVPRTILGDSIEAYTHLIPCKRLLLCYCTVWSAMA